MNADTINAARAHAAREYPRESCGFVIVENGREVYVPATNHAASASEHVRHGREEYADAEARGEVLAFVHSHPDAPATPSQADRVACEASEILWHIVSWPGDDVQTIVPCGYEAPLIGRQFAHGVLDCWALVRDWYRRERGIVLPDFERRDNWWNEEGGGSLYRDHYAECGGVIVPHLSQIEIGDVIVMEYASKQRRPNHAGVYIGDGRMLHHLHGKLSSRDLYNGAWQDRTRMILRYSP